MSLSGHRSEETYGRCNISDTKRKRKALELVQAFRNAEAARANEQANEQTSVVPMAAQK